MAGTFKTLLSPELAGLVALQGAIRSRGRRPTDICVAGEPPAPLMLSDAVMLSELLGNILPEKVADFLSQHGNLAEIGRLHESELTAALGVRAGRRLYMLLELGRRAVRPRTRDLRFTTPEDVYRYARPRMAHLTHEVFHVLLLDTKHRLVRDVRVAAGGLATCALSPRDVFEPAIREAAPALIFLHNHPSGDPTPSADDIALTVRLVAGAKVLGLAYLDHMVIADSGFKSLRELGHVG